MKALIIASMFIAWYANTAAMLAHWKRVLPNDNYFERRLQLSMSMFVAVIFPVPAIVTGFFASGFDWKWPREFVRK